MRCQKGPATGNHIHPSGVVGCTADTTRLPPHSLRNAPAGLEEEQAGVGWGSAAAAAGPGGVPGARPCSAARPGTGRFGANVCAGFALLSFPDAP